MENFKQFITENSADYEIGEYYKIYPIGHRLAEPLSDRNPLYFYHISASTYSRNPANEMLRFLNDYWFTDMRFYLLVKVKNILQSYVNSTTLEVHVVNALSVTADDIDAKDLPIKTNLQDLIHNLPIRIYQAEKHKHEKVEEGDPDFFKTVEDSF